MLGCSAHYDERTAMTNRESFTEEEWELIREAPTSAGMIVLTAQKGGSFRESFAMAKAYTEARQQHAGSELLDAVVSAKPARDHTHYHSPDELKAAGLGHLREAVALVEQKATPQEVEDYRGFVLTLADRVAHAHREDGVEVSDAERQAIEEIAAALGATAPAS
jgi:hypothetical protein